MSSHLTINFLHFQNHILTNRGSAPLTPMSCLTSLTGLIYNVATSTNFLCINEGMAGLVEVVASLR